VSDIMAPDFFSYFISTTNGCSNFTDQKLTGDDIYLDMLAKLLYSLMLTDLGQAKTTNILAHPQLIMQLLKTSLIQPFPTPPAPMPQNETMFFNWIGTVASWYDSSTSAAMEYSYPNTDLRSIPVVNPAVIAAQYFCQVPQLKSIGSLLIAIIVADLVFLQVLWKILNLAVAFGLTRRHSEAQYCDGCAKKVQRSHEGYALVDRADEEASESSLPQAKAKRPVVEMRKRSTL